MRTGLLLINLGTPDEPTPGAVRRYLREFLGDPRVLDIHPIGRALLLHLIILPTRPAKSARAYASIWVSRGGSPLLYTYRDRWPRPSMRSPPVRSDAWSDCRGSRSTRRPRPEPPRPG